MFKTSDFEKIKENFFKFLNKDNSRKIVVGLGILGILLITLPTFFKGNPSHEKNITVNCETLTSHEYTKKMEENLSDMVSKIKGAGKTKVLVTLESSKETIYATEEKQNKELGEDKEKGETTRTKERNDSEKKYITVKDSEGAEHALAVTELEPKIKGVVIVCAGGENKAVKKRITEAVTTALNITSKRVCVTSG